MLAFWEVFIVLSHGENGRFGIFSRFSWQFWFWNLHDNNNSGKLITAFLKVWKCVPFVNLVNFFLTLTGLSQIDALLQIIEGAILSIFCHDFKSQFSTLIVYTEDLPLLKITLRWFPWRMLPGHQKGNLWRLSCKMLCKLLERILICSHRILW